MYPGNSGTGRGQNRFLSFIQQLMSFGSVFTGSPAPGYLSINGASDSTVFKEFGFGSQGALIMVRPDGHMSVIESLSLDGLDVVMKFLKGFYGHTPELIR